MYDQNNEDRHNPEHVPSPQGTTPASHLFRELLNVALIAIFIVLPIRLFIAQPFIVSGSSMKPTFMDGDYLIVDQLSYRIEEPERLDVVIFRYPDDPSQFFIKRIIGLPGETIQIGSNGVTIINEANPEGTILKEEYIDTSHYEPFTTTLKDDEFFVLGDNRDASSDSRIWGPLNRKYLIGRAFLRLIPVPNAEVFPGKYKDY